ncbi:hypothetical protein PGT21_016320 [Puccinia graminis f. sp. tritici]|uniref:Uncharacterized protein n=1 Tax=Puccinia graminis f. sp. tritici TaxID=56615 RepID=A0A5B0S3T5_PUCGR|nr:hypothetical protein PGT21_016320 [Puccinia graminis f. sp. tritici]KAA1132015.1 hypothetical protein PGTUg99_035741 [Puccinia graminis f. sp. tritici]
MSNQSAIYASSSPSCLGKTAEELEVSMLLTPPGHSFCNTNSFTQAELDSLEAFVLNKIATFYKTHIPRNCHEHEDYVKLYSEICDGFRLINDHSFNTADHSGIPQGDTDSCGQTSSQS